MTFVIVTDPISIRDPLPGVTKWVKKGTRLYYCGEGPTMPTLDYAISNAVQFETTEAAELRHMILCVWEPDFVDHGHIMEFKDAWPNGKRT